MHKKYLLFLLGLIFLAFSVSASSYNLELNQMDNKILAEYTISLDSKQEIILNIPADAYSISSSISYTLEDGIFSATSNELNLSYLTSSLLEYSGGDYYFVSSFSFPLAFDNTSIKLILKEGYFTDAEKIFPKPSEIDSDGRQITMSWNLNKVAAGDDIPMFVIIKSESSRTGALITWVLSIVALLLIIYFTYDKLISRFMRKPAKKEKKKKRKKKAAKPAAEAIESHLIESEIAVINALKQADRGEMWQKGLQTKTNFSKAKLSRVIRNLESRNLIDKLPFGNTNKIRLK